MTERMIRFNGYVTGYFNIDFIDDSNEADFISTDRKNFYGKRMKIQLN